MAARIALYLIKTYELQLTQQVDLVRPLLSSIGIHIQHRFKAERVSKIIYLCQKLTLICNEIGDNWNQSSSSWHYPKVDR